MTEKRDPENETHWCEFANQWLIRSDTTYLNHGSFGPPPQAVRQARRGWIDALDCQPMDFYDRQFEPALQKTKLELADFVGAEPDNMVFVENATYGMNVLANSLTLKPGENVLLNNHEYGAVERIWNRACDRVGATVKTATLPERFESAQQIVDCLVAATDDNTRFVIVSHITSATAIVMPIVEICAAFAQRNIAVIVDGPHAPAQIELDISSLGCDFYTASCHKWLCSTLGTGFMYVAPKWHDCIQPVLQSWGRPRPAIPEKWDEEFIWSGTRDPSPYLSISAAINFLQNEVGIENFRSRSRYLAGKAEEILCEEFQTTPIANRADGWYASMAHVPLPPGEFSDLQKSLWREYQIEVPINCLDDQWFVRVSCHLYNNYKQLETLNFALRKFMM